MGIRCALLTGAIVGSTLLAACGSSADTVGAADADPVVATDVADSTAQDTSTTSAEPTTTTAPSTTVAVDVDAANTSLEEAVRGSDLDGVVAALAAGADPDLSGLVNPMVHMAAERGDLAIVQALVDAGADIEAAGTQNHSAMIRAAMADQREVLAYLIDIGADLDRRESSPGRPVLMLAIDARAEVETLELLIDAGADLDAVDERGETALSAATFTNVYEAAELLIERGIVVDTRNNEGISPLGWARTDEMRALLLANGATE